MGNNKFISTRKSAPVTCKLATTYR